MTDSDRRSLLDRLHATRDRLLGAISDVSEAQGRFKPGPETWSIVDCVEHVATGPRIYAPQITDNFTEEAETDGGGSHSDVLFLKGGVDRRRKFVAPESAQPTGGVSLAAAAERFRGNRDNRERTLVYAEECRHNLRNRFVVHPAAGKIDSYQCLLLIGVHAERHAAQIGELKQRPDFPQP